jgi:hypothetical protein
MLPVSASRGRGGGELSACQSLWTIELSFLSRFRATGDKYPRNTCSGAEKRNLESVYVVPHLQYFISEVTVVGYNPKKMTNTHMPCSENRSIYHMLDRHYYSTSTITARARLKTPKLTPLLMLTGFHEW